MTKPMRRRSKENKINVKLFIGLVPAIIATIILVNLLLSIQRNTDQTYINDVSEILNQASVLTKDYDSSLTKWKNNEIRDDEIIDLTYKNIFDMNQLVSRLNSTNPPERFKQAHQYILGSLNYQIESNRNMLKYIMTKDEQYKESSDELFQKAFEYESKALTEFNRLDPSYNIVNVGN